MAATSPIGKPAQRHGKLSRKEALRKIASLIENHMTDRGLPEKEKTRRVRRFSKRVERAIAARAKS